MRPKILDTNWYDNIHSVCTLGFNYFVGSLIVVASKKNIDQNLVSKLMNKWDVNIYYEDEVINGKTLKKVTVEPGVGFFLYNHPAPQSPISLLLFYPGHGITIAQESLLLNLIEYQSRTGSIVVAYDQAGVGLSQGPSHANDSSLRKDVRAQAQSCYQKLLNLKQTKMIHPNGKMGIYGLCFGGVLSAAAAVEIIDKEDFAYTSISRAPTRIWEMAALCPDYRRFFPGMDEADSRSKQYQPVNQSKWARACNSLLMGLMRFIIGLLNLMTFLSVNIRRVLVYPLFAISRWKLDMQSEIKQLDKASKLKLFTLNGGDTPKDEFVHREADMFSHVSNPHNLLHVKPSGNNQQWFTTYFEDSKYLKGCYATEDTYRRDIGHEGCTTNYAHQAWSGHCFIVNKTMEGTLSREDEVDAVLSGIPFPKSI